MKHLKLLEEHDLVKCHLEESDLGGPQRKIYVPTMKFTLIVDVGPNLFEARVLERRDGENNTDMGLQSGEEVTEEDNLEDLEASLNQLRETMAKIEGELKALQERRTKLVELKERISESTRKLVEETGSDYLIRRVLYEYVLRPEMGPKEIAKELAIRDEIVMDMLKDVMQQEV